jgi:hypothetical protein
LYRSAHTPLERLIKRWGTIWASVAYIRNTPDEVSRVMYQMMAYPTTEEPNRERFWLIRNRTTDFVKRALLRFVFIVVPWVSIRTGK